MSQLRIQTMKRAVGARDATFDGQFVFAVTTTGVFCKPSCPSRPAKPENLRFFATVAEAGAAGFRPCKRCRPEAPKAGADRMAAVARFIEDHAEEPLPLARLAREAGLSPAHFQKQFKAMLGSSPKAFQTAARARRLKALLRQDDSVLDAIFGAGYGSTSRVYEQAARTIGMTPSAYRAGGKGEQISFACRATGLGMLLMAATDRGVCAVMFGDAAADSVAQLRAEFPNAQLTETPPQAAGLLNAWISALDEHLSRGGPHPALPLDVRGTAFQLMVWRFLMTIPAGQAISYSELAQGIGKPKAVRAAASACAANRIALLIPCHRVLRGTGALGGYRWGLDRKRALLTAERQRAAT